MGKVIWSPTAYKDIDLVAEYIAKDSLDRASQFVSKLVKQTDQLKSFSKAGRRIPEINENSKREIIYGSYRIMYRIVTNGDVWITGIVHGSKDWKPK